MDFIFYQTLLTKKITFFNLNFNAFAISCKSVLYKKNYFEKCFEKEAYQLN